MTPEKIARKLAEQAACAARRAEIAIGIHTVNSRRNALHAAKRQANHARIAPAMKALIASRTPEARTAAITAAMAAYHAVEGTLEEQPAWRIARKLIEAQTIRRTKANSPSPEYIRTSRANRKAKQATLKADRLSVKIAVKKRIAVLESEMKARRTESKNRKK